MTDYETSTAVPLTNSHLLVGAVLMVTVVASNLPARTDMTSVGGTDAPSAAVRSSDGPEAFQAAVIRAAKSLSVSINEAEEAKLDVLMSQKATQAVRQKITKARRG